MHKARFCSILLSMGHFQQNRELYLSFISQRLLHASSFIFGICFAFLQSPYPAFFCLLGIVSLYGMTRSIKKTALQLLFFILGYGSATYRFYQYERIRSGIEQKTFDLKVLIENIEPTQHALYKSIVLASVKEHRNIEEKAAMPTSWRVQLFLGHHPKFEVGDTVLLSKVKIPPISGDDFKRYLIKENIHATVFLKDNAYSVLFHPSFHFGRNLHAYKHALLKNIRTKCTTTTFALFSSIFLGNRNCIKRDYQSIKEPFNHWGIIHFLARSGLHLVIIVMLLTYIFNRIPIHFFAKQILILFFILFYALLTWSSISFDRSCATIAWYTFCRISLMHINTANIVLTLSCLFLLCNPMLLFFLDFQLSFGLTLVLSLINQPLTASK